MNITNYKKEVVVPKSAPTLVDNNPLLTLELITMPTMLKTANPNTNDMAYATTNITSIIILVSTFAFVITFL